MSIPNEQPPAPVEKPRRGFHASDLLYAVLVVVIIVGILEIWPSNYYMFLPGQALSVTPMIQIGGHPFTRTRGKLLMTDVSLYRVNHKLEELYGRVNPDATLEQVQNVSGNLSTKQFNQYNVQLMQDSQLAAEVAALQAAGYQVQYPPVKVQSTVPNTPAAKVLKAGDVLLAVNGRPVHAREDIARALSKLKPGQVVSLTVQRGGRSMHINVRTIHSTSGTPDKNGKTPLIGVLIGYAQGKIHLPVKIHIKVGDISGPSAGLMFALGIIEELKNQDLTHGCTVAGTGEIAIDGTVSAIGGAKQKVIAARNAGAQYFLVPNAAENVQPAMQNRGSIKVVPVGSLLQALSFLQHIHPCK